MSRPVEISHQEGRLQLQDDSVQVLVDAIDAFNAFSVPEGSLDIAFVDLSTCSQLHEDFFGDSDPTDVMTFPGVPGDNHAGDIAVCPAIAAEASGESGLTFQKELSLYIVHACLHLAGLRDDSEKHIARMREGESRLMQHLESSNAFLKCTWKDEHSPES